MNEQQLIKQLVECECEYLKNLHEILQQSTFKIEKEKLSFETIVFHMQKENDDKAAVEIKRHKAKPGEHAIEIEHLFNAVQYQSKEYQLKMKQIISQK